MLCIRCTPFGVHLQADEPLPEPRRLKPHMPPAPLQLLRHTAPALRRGLLWLLVLAWCWQSQASLLQHLLGSVHHHTAQHRAVTPWSAPTRLHDVQARLPAKVHAEWQAMAQQVDAWALALRARRASALLVHVRPQQHAQVSEASELAYPTRFGHMQGHLHEGLHEGLERHHHAPNDATVTTSGEVLADEGLAGNGSAGGLGTLALPAELPAGLQTLRLAAAVQGWPTGHPSRWTSADPRLPERPPRA